MVNVPGNGFVSTTGLLKLDDLVNKMKSLALEVLNHVLKYIFEKVPNSVKKKSPFLPKSIQFCPFLAHSLIAVGQRADILTLVENEVFGDLIVEAIETLVYYSGEPEFQDDLIKASRPLLVHVAFNLLRTQQSELNIMQADADEFVQLALDTCDKQKSRIVKTQAAKLLEAMCDNVDGAVSFVTLFTC
jgi:hypothetical protein